MTVDAGDIRKWLIVSPKSVLPSSYNSIQSEPQSDVETIYTTSIASEDAIRDLLHDDDSILTFPHYRQYRQINLEDILHKVITLPSHTMHTAHINTTEDR